MQALLNSIIRAIGNHPFIVGLLGTLGSFMVVAVPFWLIADGEHTALERAREKSESIASILERGIERNGHIYDAQLKAIVLNAEDPRTWRLPKDIQQRLLFRAIPDNSYVDGQFLLDEEGKIIASNYEGEIRPDLRLNDREYFRVHQENPNLGLFVSHPYKSRIREGKHSIALSRRVNKPDGSFGGVAYLVIRIEFAQRLFEHINIDDTGNVGIIMTDGTIVARKPYDERDIGLKISFLPVFKTIAASSSGTVAGISRDGSQRLFTYQRTPNLPMIILVAPSVDKVTQHWQEQMFITKIVTVALGVVLILGGWILTFTLRDKLKTQDLLTSLATTDALTKLSNRRVLADRLQQIWSQAVKDKHCLSILFIDIDHFKCFNDIRGHAAGDLILIQVAQSISQEIQDDDVAARYGGEEFVVVLPDTDNEEATSIAEAIRLRVHGQRIAHEGTDAGRVTISIGCASYFPYHGGTADRLLSEADNELYDAKAKGRNQVRSVSLTRTSFMKPKKIG